MILDLKGNTVSTVHKIWISDYTKGHVSDNNANATMD